MFAESTRAFTEDLLLEEEKNGLKVIACMLRVRITAMRSVSTWRCRCGLRIKVVTEFSDGEQGEKVSVACPKCGDTQTVYGSVVISVKKDTTKADEWTGGV